MRPTEFCAHFDEGKPGPVYFLRGPDRFIHEECRAAVVCALPAEARQWCLTESEFRPGQLARELENAYQMPMLGKHSFLYLADSDDFGHAHEEDIAALESFLKSPPAFSTVVFAAYEPDRRRRFIQLLERKAEVVEAEPLARREAAEWIRAYLRKASIEIRPDLAERVVAKFENSGGTSGRAKGSGVNLLWLRTEMEKLRVARPEMQRLAESDLDLIVAFREEHEIGKLLAAIAERQLPNALRLLHELLASKEPETLLLWSIGDLFRQALKSSSAPSNRYGSRSAKLFSTYEIAPRAHHAYSLEELAQAIRLVRGADLAIKSSWKDSRMLLESLLWQIMAGKGPDNFLRRFWEGSVSSPAG